MGSESAEVESKMPKLPLFSMHSPERSGVLTPPLQSSSAAVPFRWEQEPGKPIPCTALVTFSNPNDLLPKCLELPPRLLIPSPTTLLQAPYVSTNIFRSPSFRISNNCYGSDTGMLGAMVLINGKGRGRGRGRGRFGSWRKKVFKVKREVTGGSHVFPSDKDTNVADTHKPKIKRSGSSSTLFHAKSRVWASICEGLKQVVPWKSKKLKKDGSGLSL